MQSEMHEKDAVLIDCRNHKEYSIGRFDGAVDPNTRTFCEFFDWVKSKESQGTFSDKKVFMYCTGGIRCEKASAFVRQSTGAKDGKFYENLCDAANCDVSSCGVAMNAFHSFESVVD